MQSSGHAFQREAIYSLIYRATLMGLFLVLALMVLVQSNPTTRAASRDYGIYLYVGKQITEGKLPYRDAWESKPPGIFYIDALALQLGGGSRWGVWFVEYIFLLGAIGISFLLLERLWGFWPALAGVVLWVIGLNLTLLGGNFTEEYPLLFHFLAVYCFIDLIHNPQKYKLGLVLGITFAVSFLFRPNNALLEFFAILIVCLNSFLSSGVKAAFRVAVLIGLGILVIWGICGLYIWSLGIWPDMITAALLYNFSYSAATRTSSSPLIMGFRTYGVIAWLSVLGYCIALLRVLRKSDQQHLPLYWLMIISYPTIIYLSDPSKRNYVHYFMNWLPLIAILGALTTSYILSLHPTLDRRGTPFTKTVAVGVMLGLALLYFIVSGKSAEYNTALTLLQHRQSLQKIDYRSKVSVYVKAHTDPTDKVLFWGAVPAENLMADRETASRILIYPYTIPSDLAIKNCNQFLLDLKNTRPVLIVDMGDPEVLSLNPVLRVGQLNHGIDWAFTPKNIYEVFAFIEANYTHEVTVAGRDIYRLKTSK